MHSYFKTFGKYLSFTNMPTAQQRKGHKGKKVLVLNVGMMCLQRGR